VLVDKSDLAKCIHWAVKEEQRIVPRLERRTTI